MGSVNIDSLDDLRTALKEIGYSNRAISEIIKWYSTNRPAI